MSPPFLRLRPAKSLWLAIGLVIAYAIVLLWFRQVDVYWQRFLDSGSVVVTYQSLRVLFILALAWLIYAVGAAVMVATAGRAFLWKLPTLDRSLLGFFIGAGVWNLVLFGFGLAGLYIWSVLAAATTMVAILSIPHMASCLRAFGRRLARMRFPTDMEGWASTILLLAVLFVACTFTLIRGIYPLGGHDYYMHYFNYLTEVARTGSLEPNAVWYHFYYTKGVSLFFLGMILTDPIAPALMSTMLVGFGAAVVCALLRYATDARLLPLCGALLYIVFFVVGNDELEKQHIPAAITILAMIWVATRLFFDEHAQPWPWIIALCAAMATSIMITLQLGLLIAFYFAGFLAWFAWKRQWHKVAWSLGFASTAVLCVAAIGALNYAYTGLPHINFLLEAWRFSDLNRFRDWGVLYEVIMLHGSFTGLVGAALNPGSGSVTLAAHQAWSWNLALILANYARLTLWWPLVLPVVLFLPLRLWSGTAQRLVGTHYLAVLGALSWFLICILMVGAVAGRTEIDTVMRLMSLAYPVPLCLILLLWHLSLHPVAETSPFVSLGRAAIACATVPGMWLVASYSSSRPELSRAGMMAITRNSWSLLSGRYSLKDAYQNQLGWIAKHPDGGIFTGIVTPWQIVGPHPASICITVVPQLWWASTNDRLSVRLKRHSSIETARMHRRNARYDTLLQLLRSQDSYISLSRPRLS